MTEDGEIPAYRVTESADLFEVQSPSGICILVCRDLSSAEQYALTLSDAYRQGYRQAVRDMR